MGLAFRYFYLLIVKFSQNFEKLVNSSTLSKILPTSPNVSKHQFWGQGVTSAQDPSESLLTDLVPEHITLQEVTWRKLWILKMGSV